MESFAKSIDLTLRHRGGTKAQLSKLALIKCWSNDEITTVTDPSSISKKIDETRPGEFNEFIKSLCEIFHKDGLMVNQPLMN